MFGDSPGKLRGVRSVRFFCRFVVGLASMAQSARELAKELAVYCRDSLSSNSTEDCPCTRGSCTMGTATLTLGDRDEFVCQYRACDCS